MLITLWYSAPVVETLHSIKVSSPLSPRVITDLYKAKPLNSDSPAICLNLSPHRTSCLPLEAWVTPHIRHCVCFSITDGLPHAHSSRTDLRDANDAHIVFEAVRLGVLPLIKRRLTSDERDQLTSGNVFVWEEAEHKGGLERWTDGRRWYCHPISITYVAEMYCRSQSRMRGDYLFYEEKIEITPEEKDAKAARR